MKEGTNEIYGENYNGGETGYNTTNTNTTGTNVENAFSDLVTEYLDGNKNGNCNVNVPNSDNCNYQANGYTGSNIPGTTSNLYTNLAGNDATYQNANTGVVNGIHTGDTQFKITQSNLPAKISFWTKLKNFFFVTDSNIQYSVEKPATKTPSTSVWRKVRNFFFEETETEK